MLRLVEEQTQKDDETTAKQLHKMLQDRRYNISWSTILRGRTQLGWTYRGSAYCQLNQIREANKAKRLEWARQHLHEAVTDSFDNIIFPDECSVQMESHKRRSYRKKGQRQRANQGKHSKSATYFAMSLNNIREHQIHSWLYIIESGTLQQC